MSRATTAGGASNGPLAFVAFILGVALGLGLVAPVLPGTMAGGLQALLRSAGNIVVLGTLAFGALLVMLAVLFQGYRQV